MCIYNIFDIINKFYLILKSDILLIRIVSSWKEFSIFKDMISQLINRMFVIKLCDPTRLTSQIWQDVYKFNSHLEPEELKNIDYIFYLLFVLLTGRFFKSWLLIFFNKSIIDFLIKIYCFKTLTPRSPSSLDCYCFIKKKKERNKINKCRDFSNHESPTKRELLGVRRSIF
jgi:hypothetical protein